MRRLVYIDREFASIKIFNLTEEEEKKYEEFVEDDDYFGDDFDVVEGMLKARGVDDVFPVYFVTESYVDIYNDDNQTIISL